MAAESGGGEGENWKCPNPDCGKVLPGLMPGLSYCPDCESPCRPSAAEDPPLADETAEENRNKTSGEDSSQNAEIGSGQTEPGGGGTVDQSLPTTATEGEPADQQISPAAPVDQGLQKVEQSASCTETDPFSLDGASPAVSKTGGDKFETAVEETGDTTWPKDDGKHEAKESSEQQEGSEVYYDARSNTSSAGNDKQVEDKSPKLEAKQEKQKSESQKDRKREAEQRQAERERKAEERKKENLRKQEAKAKKEKEVAEKRKQELQERERQRKIGGQSTGVADRATVSTHPLSKDENENKSKNGAGKVTASGSGRATRGAAGESKTGTSENKGESRGESGHVSFNCLACAPRVNNRTPMIGMTMKLGPSTSPITKIFKTDLHACKKYTSTANLNVFFMFLSVSQTP